MPPNQTPFTLAPMMPPAPDSSFLGAMMKMRQMFPKQGALPGVAPAQGQQGMNGLPTDQSMNGSGMYTGPANQPGFGPPAGQPLSLDPSNPGPSQGPGLLGRMWGSLAPGAGPQPMMPQGGMNGW